MTLRSLNCSGECHFAVSFMHLRLRRKDYRKVGESRVGHGYRRVNQVVCSLRLALLPGGLEEGH